MIIKSGCSGGYQAVDEGQEEGIRRGGDRGREGYKESDGLEKKSSNKLLPAARGKRYREVVGKQDRVSRSSRLSEMWGGRRDTRPHCVPV